MKLVLRIVILLAAALVVAGALLAFSHTGLAEGLRAAGPGHVHSALEHDGGQRGSFAGSPEGFQRGEGRHGHGEHHGPSLLGLGGLVTNLVKVGVIVAVVALGAWLLQLGHNRARRDPPPPAAAVDEAPQ